MDEKQFETNLATYCDLGTTRYYCLVDAEAGKLTTMNGAMHQAMREAIDHDLALTDYGRELLERARKIVAGELPQGERFASPHVPAAMARMMRRDYAQNWIRSVHVKILITLFQHPEQAFGHLVNVYSYRSLKEVMDQGLVRGQERIGAPFKLTSQGDTQIRGLNCAGQTRQECLL